MAACAVLWLKQRAQSSGIQLECPEGCRKCVLILIPTAVPRPSEQAGHSHCLRVPPRRRFATSFPVFSSILTPWLATAAVSRPVLQGRVEHAFSRMTGALAGGLGVGTSLRCQASPSRPLWSGDDVHKPVSCSVRLLFQRLIIWVLMNAVLKSPQLDAPTSTKKKPAHGYEYGSGPCLSVYDARFSGTSHGHVRTSLDSLRHKTSFLPPPTAWAGLFSRYELVLRG